MVRFLRTGKSASQSVKRSTEIDANNPRSIDDFHHEMLVKRNSLKPVNERELAPPRVQPIPIWKQIAEEIQKKIAEKINNNKNVMSKN